MDSMRSNHRCHSKLVRAGSTPTFLPQCTFWCRVLTDRSKQALAADRPRSQCTFWCRVLTDLGAHICIRMLARSQCTFWCRVLTDLRAKTLDLSTKPSQCTFWCRVLTDRRSSTYHRRPFLVSMHLLVPGAYRPVTVTARDTFKKGLNAPSGAGCLPTSLV